MLNNYLQLFAEDSAAAGSGDASAESAGNAQGEGMAAGAGAEETAPPGGDETPEESWDSLIKGKYKEDYSKSVERVVKKRVGNLHAQIDAMAPALELIARKYGIQRDQNGNLDYAAISKAVQGDDSIYQDEAYRRGISVDELKRTVSLEQENASLRARVEQDDIQRGWEDIQMQAQALKQAYPKFDLDTEMQNEEFGRLVTTLQKNGFKDALSRAYKTIHLDELTADSMRYAVQRTSEKIANSVRSGAARPQENGAGTGSPAGMKGVDLKNLTKAQIDDYIRRARNGERITFT